MCAMCVEIVWSETIFFRAKNYEGRRFMKMSEEAMAAKRAYQKKWRASNRERIREYNRLYWERQAQKAKAMESKTNEKADK